MSPWQHTDDKMKIRTYNIVILFLIAFIISDTVYDITRFVGSEESKEPRVTFSTTVKDSSSEFLNHPSAITITSNMIPPVIIFTNGVPSLDEFFVGEVVGVKYFGIYGIVTEKIISVNGYKYEVRWRDASRGLPKDTFYEWELFRPSPNSIPTTVFQN